MVGRGWRWIRDVLYDNQAGLHGEAFAAYSRSMMLDSRCVKHAAVAMSRGRTCKIRCHVTNFPPSFLSHFHRYAHAATSALYSCWVAGYCTETACLSSRAIPYSKYYRVADSS